MKERLGRQTMLELYGCKNEHLNDIEFIKTALLKAAEIAKATIVQQYFHQFSPYGISGTVVITESHINIHTWPEHDFAAIDFFTCNDDMEVEKACAYLKEVFEAVEQKMEGHDRGSMLRVRRLLEQRRELKV